VLRGRKARRLSIRAAKPKILVIDDSEVVLEVTRSALEGAGYQVITHDRPAGCVALLLHEKPDLVLMDVNMPGLGGDTIVSVFGKAQPKGDTIVLLYSSLSSDVLRAKAATAGAHGFLQKSGDTFGLVREVNRWLKRGASSGNMRVASVASNPGADERRPMSTLTVSRSSGSGSFEAVSSPPPSRSTGGRPSGTVRASAATVLLVDDDMTALSGYRRQLQTENLTIEFALSGAQALRRILSETPPDVVVCDMLLPDVSGVDVYRRAVASDPSFRQRFTVATGASGVSAVAEFLQGFGGPVLYKPVDTSLLVSAVRACLGGVRRFREA